MPIHQQVKIQAKPSAVFDTLLNSARFTEMTGGRKAEISRETGGACTMFDGDIQARNVEVVDKRRLVQAWRSVNWPEGVYSIVRFELEDQGGNTMLTFDQAGHPEDATQMLEGGWHQMYWEPMNALLRAD